MLSTPKIPWTKLRISIKREIRRTDFKKAYKKVKNIDFEFAIWAEIWFEGQNWKK